MMEPCEKSLKLIEEIGEAQALMESIWIFSNVSLVIQTPKASNKTKKCFL